MVIKCGDAMYMPLREDLGSGMLHASCKPCRMIEAQVLVHLTPHDDAHDLLARVMEKTDKRYDDHARDVGADSICAPF